MAGEQGLRKAVFHFAVGVCQYVSIKFRVISFDSEITALIKYRYRALDFAKITKFSTIVSLLQEKGIFALNFKTL